MIGVSQLVSQRHHTVERMAEIQENPAFLQLYHAAAESAADLAGTAVDINPVVVDRPFGHIIQALIKGSEVL